MPVKLRCKRHFVLQTVDGPLITVNPTPKSVLPASFKKAKTRSLNPDGSKKEADPPPTTRHAGGGAVLEFAPIMPIPDSFGVPADDDELRKRERLGTVDRQSCALCAHLFDVAKLQFLVSRKAVVEQQTRWGRHELLGKDLTPANLYTSCRVCLFCYQFFEEKVQESSSVITSHQSNSAGQANHHSAPYGSPSSSAHASPQHSNNRSNNTIVLVNKSAGGRASRPSSSAASFFQRDPFASSSLSSPQLQVGDVIYQPVPDNLSAPEYLEEVRIVQEQKCSQKLLQCLSREWEAGERATKAYTKKMTINEHRRREAARWSEEVARVRQSYSAANNSTTAPAFVMPPSAMATPSILKSGGGGGSSTNYLHHENEYLVVPPSPSASPSMLAGEFSATGDEMMPLIVTLSDAHEGGGGACAGIDAAGSSIDTAGSIGRKSRRGTSHTTATTTAVDHNGSTTITTSIQRSDVTATVVCASGGGGGMNASFLAARNAYASSSPSSARGGGVAGPPLSSPRQPTSTGGLLDFSALELAEDNGEIELTDDLRAILIATPRSARSGGMHSNMNEPNAYLLARERLEASRRDAAANGLRPGTAPGTSSSRVVDFLHPTQNKAHQLRMEAAAVARIRNDEDEYLLRMEAAAVARIRNDEDEYLRDCERRGMCPSTSRLVEFANQIMIVGSQARVMNVKTPKKLHTPTLLDATSQQRIVTQHEAEARVVPDPSQQTPTLLQALRHQKGSRQRTTNALIVAQRDRQDVYHAAHERQLFREDSAMYQNGSKRFAMYSL
ncbi:Hypothetical protein, putative [Bodo saltans]|uniref:Uncharacterized protein n=1 Tax=Bodo saltans TaxID=75058 RepID=A0A0S4IVF0_BODSA|nr:Hypothetical protein, putative [Bodo saltans]|eukprot:CUF57387.1 Hypothetical protein, putative [Bodo saltans]